MNELLEILNNIDTVMYLSAPILIKMIFFSIIVELLLLVIILTWGGFLFIVGLIIVLISITLWEWVSPLIKNKDKDKE